MNATQIFLCVVGMLLSTPTYGFTVGILSLQGGVSEHVDALERINISSKKIYNSVDLNFVDALIIPGGESTSLKVLTNEELLYELQTFIKYKPVWGVCAGIIALANNSFIGGLNIDIERNAYGRQAYSSYRYLDNGKYAYFIRSPKIINIGSHVEIIARVIQNPDQIGWERHECNNDAGGEIVGVRQNNIMGTTFHPEISYDDSWLKYFLTKVCNISLLPITYTIDTLTSAPWVSNKFDSVGVKRAFAVYQKGGVIMDVTNIEQAKLAERAGAVAVMALERIPADIRADGGVARSSDPRMISEILNAVSIPVMAKARIGHIYEANVLQALEVDCIDESEVLTAADEKYHIDKTQFKIPFVNGAQNLGEALRRIAEGSSMIRLKGDAGTGNVAHAVRHARALFSEIRKLETMREDELYEFSKEHRVPLNLVQQTKKAKRLPVITFAAGGIATPADVGLLMDLGCDGVFVGSGIFKGNNPEKRARAMVEACAFYKNHTRIANISNGLGKGMAGLLEHTMTDKPGVDKSVAN